MKGRSGLDYSEDLIFEISTPGHTGIDLPPSELDNLSSDAAKLLGSEIGTQDLGLPECTEPEVFRHYTKMSRWNYAIDLGTYPLGSCTMKYNPKINEWAARLPGFAALHPYLPEEDIQGALELMWYLQNDLKEIGGFAAVNLQPSAGAQGEFLGVLMMLTALKERGEKRTKMLVPESAHGTNPATAGFFGLEVVSIKSNQQGTIDASEVKRLMDQETVGIMITNPNTLGIFEKDILKIANLVHEKGGYVYGDGANLNALMGIARPGDFGIDVMHFNLHKTFTTPHGGGGPGCGAVGASERLVDYLPVPFVVQQESGGFAFKQDAPKSVGRIRSFYGNFGMMVRAFAYMKEMGGNGLKQASQMAVLNANYVKARLKGDFHVAFGEDCLHEVILSDKKQLAESGVSTLDMAKRLIDHGYHPPTVYFPLVVKGAMMIEPTETESKRELDGFCDAMQAIAKECQEDPEKVKSAPHSTALGRLNEAQAARKPVLKYASSSQN